MGRGGWNKGLSRTAEERKAISRGTLRGMRCYINSISKQAYKKIRVNAGKKTSKKLKGRKLPWMEGKTYEEIYGVVRAKELRNQRSNQLKGVPKSAEHRRKIREQRAFRVIRYKDTAPEKSVQRFLLKLGVKFEKHGRISGCYHQFDILIPSLKLAIEVDGCYWHGCRKCFTEISAGAKIQRKRDNTWMIVARKLGWQAVRIWEHDVRVGKFSKLLEVLNG